VGPTLWGWSRVWDRNNEDGWDGDKFLSPSSSLIDVYTRIEASIDMDISMDVHVKSVDMDMYINAKFHIHGKPD